MRGGCSTTCVLLLSKEEFPAIQLGWPLKEIGLSQVTKYQNHQQYTNAHGLAQNGEWTILSSYFLSKFAVCHAHTRIYNLKKLKEREGHIEKKHHSSLSWGMVKR